MYRISKNLLISLLLVVTITSLCLFIQSILSYKQVLLEYLTYIIWQVLVLIRNLDDIHKQRRINKWLHLLTFGYFWVKLVEFVENVMYHN